MRRISIFRVASPDIAAQDAIHIAAASIEECSSHCQFAGQTWKEYFQSMDTKTTICTRELVIYTLRDAYAAEHRYDLDRIFEKLKRPRASSALQRIEFRALELSLNRN